MRRVIFAQCWSLPREDGCGGSPLEPVGLGDGELTPGSRGGNRPRHARADSIAERAPDDATAEYLHKVFEPTALAVDRLEKALGGLGLLDQALAMDMRRPQDYFSRIWNTGFPVSDVTDEASTSSDDEDEYEIA